MERDVRPAGRDQLHRSVLHTVRRLLLMVAYALVRAFATAASGWCCGYYATGWPSVRPVTEGCASGPVPVAPGSPAVEVGRERAPAVEVGRERAPAVEVGRERALAVEVARGIREIEVYLAAACGDPPRRPRDHGDPEAGAGHA